MGRAELTRMPLASTRILFDVTGFKSTSQRGRRSSSRRSSRRVVSSRSSFPRPFFVSSFSLSTHVSSPFFPFPFSSFLPFSLSCNDLSPNHVVSSRLDSSFRVAMLSFFRFAAFLLSFCHTDGGCQGETLFHDAKHALQTYRRRDVASFRLRSLESWYESSEGTRRMR